MASAETTLPETITDSQPTIADQLEKQIETLRSQVNSLAAHKEALRSTLLSLPASQQLLTDAQHSIPSDRQEQIDKYQKLLDERNDEAVVSTYRLGVGTTQFDCKDPNPYAVDGGRVTGIRFEKFNRVTRSYDKPDYILFNRPFAQHPGHLQIHKHTLPSYIQVASLAEKHLSHTGQADGVFDAQVEQRDLAAFVRAVRRELMARSPNVML